MRQKQKRRFEPAPFEIIVDTREQRPFSFAGIRHRSGRLIVPRIVKTTLKSGDYSIVGFENQIAIERKSISDLFSSVGSSRERFVKELRRLSAFRFAAIVVEADYGEIANDPPPYTKMSPDSVINSLLAWQVRYGVHVVPMPDRRRAEEATFVLLRTFAGMAGAACDRK